MGQTGFKYSTVFIYVNTVNSITGDYHEFDLNINSLLGTARLHFMKVSVYIKKNIYTNVFTTLIGF